MRDHEGLLRITGLLYSEGFHVHKMFDSDYYRAMLKSLEKHGFMKGRKLTERGLDLAWHVMERYRMTYGIDPQEPEIKPKEA